MGVQSRRRKEEEGGTIPRQCYPRLGCIGHFRSTQIPRILIGLHSLRGRSVDPESRCRRRCCDCERDGEISPSRTLSAVPAAYTRALERWKKFYLSVLSPPCRAYFPISRAGSLVLFFFFLFANAGRSRSLFTESRGPTPLAIAIPELHAVTVPLPLSVFLFRSLHTIPLARNSLQKH